MAVQREAAAMPQPDVAPRFEVECAVYRHGQTYRAVCLDLALIVERSTPDEAASELMELIRSYVHDARTVGQTWKQIRRPVSKSERLYVDRKIAVAALRRLITDAITGPRTGRRGRPESFEFRVCPV